MAQLLTIHARFGVRQLKVTQLICFTNQPTFIVEFEEKFRSTITRIFDAFVLMNDCKPVCCSCDVPKQGK